jgi:CubicO group peptidase (beta-lactamase class C family)
VEGKDYSVAERMAFYKVPGASLVIIKDFKVASVAHWGKRNANSPITDDTLYQIGAMGQPLVTVAALRAAERGAISLDTNIDTYLKTWKIPSSNTLDPKRGITLRDLLTQRSGFTFHKYSGYASDAPIPTLLQVLKGEKPATTPPASVTGIPGKTFTLAAENYTVLQQVAADITGEPFDSVLRSEVFAPLGLEKSNALQPLPENRRGNAAFGHNAQGTPLPGGYRIYPEIAASGIWSTPREYALFLADVLKSIAGQEGTLLQKETAQLLITPISSDANSVQTMGFGINRRNGVPILFRGGNSEGFYCHLDADFEKGDAIIFFANGDLCWRLSNEVRDAVGRTEGFRGYTSP